MALPGIEAWWRAERSDRLAGRAAAVALSAIRCYICPCEGIAVMNVAFTRAGDGLARRAFSVHDIRRMVDAGILDEHERIELIEGDLVMMSSKGYAHDYIKNILTVKIARALPDSLMMGVEMTVQFADDTILEPDIAVFARSALIRSEANFSHIRPAGLLLAIEVAASSLAYDRGLKARLYARHRVQEFWVVDANERINWIHTGPTREGWSSIVERGPDETLTTAALPDFSIRLGEID
jgi:Uma2 family endonuclease